jgi:DNA-binding GntR family transcriptional regulator
MSYSCCMTQQRAGTGQAKYKAIAADLRAKIESGEYPVGSRLPTHDALIKTYDVALNTVREALGELRDAGRVITQQGVGTVVIEPPAQEPTPQFRALMEQITGLSEGFRQLSEGFTQLSARVETLEQAGEG